MASGDKRWRGERKRRREEGRQDTKMGGKEGGNYAGRRMDEMVDPSLLYSSRSVGKAAFDKGNENST